uniref:Nuclear RNA export factor 2 n=1 Tax=Glossina palpalis gambiensis TaxID=67801 RepID=A0A1B0BA70_9MUSC
MNILGKKYHDVIHFPEHPSIEINYSNTNTYTKCRSYDAKAMNQGFVWHQIVVQHNGKICGSDAKRDILDALFEAVNNEEIYPIAYRRGPKEDCFLVRQCQPALDKLFAQNLRLRLPNGHSISILVQLNVADFHQGQISPITQITKALSQLYNSMERYNGEDGILNLSQFGRNPNFADVVVNLGNSGVLERICNLIYSNDEKFRNVNGILMKTNGIKTLAPLKQFTGVEFAILDLRDNKLRSPERITRELLPLQADELMLAGNPVINTSKFPDCLNPVLKNFKRIDGIPSENYSKDYSPLNKNGDKDSEGYRVDWSNRADINNFEFSNDWHAVMIPDPEHNHTKDDIFNYFFITVSPTFSDFYPCYYKFDKGEHQFLVRQCFDQIKHLVEYCNLEIGIPRIVQQTVTEDSDLLPEVEMYSKLVYYLLMNISPFKTGQVNPLECIDKALNRRYNAVDRVLNLSNFQDTEGLQNIVINLNSINILSRLLMQASKKFASSVVELRLAHNKIVFANVPKVLVLMGNLKAIDLGNNWIHHLKDVNELSVFKLKCLRLDGNPLCSKYSFAGEYIEAVKEIFQDLENLDNIEITTKGNLSSQKNYLCDVAAYDLTQEFVTRYFKTFECVKDRAKLKDVYHANAMLTLTCNYFSANSTQKTRARIRVYGDVSRNILKMRDLPHAYGPVHYGREEIMAIIMSLPDVSFDMLTFNTDTTIHNDRLTAITINGVYLDQAKDHATDTDVVMAFSRTFLLTPVKHFLGPLNKGTSYKIINDQLNILNPTAAQTKIAFKYLANDNIADDENEISLKTKESMLIMLQELTHLKSVWCARCLEDAGWDLQKALEVFIGLCRNDEISDASFM